MVRTLLQPPPPRSRRLLASGLAVLLVLGWGLEAFGQRPYAMHDPFYRSEDPQRVFFGGYALSAELSYRAAGALRPNDFQSLQANPMGLTFRVDYQLSSQLDLSAIVDAAGNSFRRNLSLSWIVLKYYERSDESSFALRFAVDPSFDGRLGFPQMDIAWLSSSPLTRTLTTDFAFGVRRVRIGYEKLLFDDIASGSGFGIHNDPGGPDIGVERVLDFIYTRALGWEMHLMLGYDFRFDPVGSNIFFSILGQAGTYDLLESEFAGGTLTEKLVNNDVPNQQQPRSIDFLGGVVWLRGGLEFNRPSFRVLPYIGIPLQQWIPTDGEWPRSQKHAGVRLMLR